MTIRYWLSPSQRDVMIAHLDKVDVPIVRAANCDTNVQAREVQSRLQTTQSLISRGLLKYDNRLSHPTHTMITEEGRAALCNALAEWADALSSAMQRSDSLRERIGAIGAGIALRSILNLAPTHNRS